MEPALPPPQRDPEFGAAGAGPGELLPDPVNPHLYLRIVANPFLGLAGLVGWLILLRLVLLKLRRIPELFAPLLPAVVVVFLALLWITPALFHFHCLDCGRTGRLSRWRLHSCPRSSWRRASGRARRLRGPTPFVQIVLWLWALLTLALIAGSHGWRPSG